MQLFEYLNWNSLEFEAIAEELIKNDFIITDKLRVIT